MLSYIKLLPIGIAIAVFVAIGTWFSLSNVSERGDVSVDIVWSGSGDSVRTDVSPATFGELIHAYRSSAYNFSFAYPEGFLVREVPHADGTSVLVENESTKRGIQIYIVAFSDSVVDISEERIRTDIPDMEVQNPQEVHLGEQSGKGLAFVSDNEAFDGSSREVWFVYRGNLYQISTYLEYDTLLQEIMGTWRFE